MKQFLAIVNEFSSHFNEIMFFSKDIVELQDKKELHHFNEAIFYDKKRRYQINKAHLESDKSIILRLTSNLQ